MRWADRTKRHRFFAAAALIGVGLGLVAWCVLSILPTGRSPSNASATGTAGVGPTLPAALSNSNHDSFNFKAADLPVALVCDYYEHGIEHTPPRDPSGAMQRREEFYVAPHDPFDLIRAASGTSQADVQLRAKLDIWEKGFRAGKDDSDIIDDVAWLAERSSLSPETVLDAGRAFNFLFGDKVAAAFFEVALDKAQEKYKSTQAGDPIARPLLRALDQTKALWRLRDHPALEKRFALAAALNAPLSVESRRAGCLHATALFYQQRYDDACDAIFKVWEQHKQAGDLGAMEKSDFGEMYWVTSLYLFCAGRYKEAIPYYQQFVLTDDGRRQQGERMLVQCLRQTGQNAEADRQEKVFGLDDSEARRAAELMRRRRPATTQPQ